MCAPATSAAGAIENANTCGLNFLQMAKANALDFLQMVIAAGCSTVSGVLVGAYSESEPDLSKHVLVGAAVESELEL